MVESKLVELVVAGSNPVGHPTFYSRERPDLRGKAALETPRCLNGLFAGEFAGVGTPANLFRTHPAKSHWRKPHHGEKK